MTARPISTRRAFGAALFGQAALATGPFFTHAVTGPSATTSMVRMGLGALFLAPFVRLRRTLPWRTLVPAGLVFGIGMTSFATATHYLGLATMFVLGATMPAWVAVAERVAFGTRLTRAALVAVAFAMTGGALAAVDRSGSGANQLLGLACYALYLAASVTDFLLVRHMSARSQATEYVFAIAAVGALVVAPLGLHGLPRFSAHDLALVAGWALCAGLFGRPALAWAQRYLSATAAVVIGEAAVPLGALFGWLIYSEVPGTFTLVGGAVVVLGVLLLHRHADDTRIDDEPYEIALSEGAVEALDGGAPGLGTTVTGA